MRSAQAAPPAAPPLWLLQERDDGRCMSGADRALVVVLAQTRGYRLTWDGFQKNLLHNLTPNDTTCTDLGTLAASL